MLVADGGDILIGRNNSFSQGVQIAAKRGLIRTGSGVFVGANSEITSINRIDIGNDVLIAERVTIRDQNHDIHGDLTLPISHAGFVDAPILICDGAWIAAGAVILKGVTIGKGAVVAANAVVNRNVADFEVVGGVPARHLGFRGAS
ncbi:MAG: acyltransferase [Burkholderiales bacterium]|nr:acyltransferase [Burkholderiales bacterium]